MSATSLKIITAIFALSIITTITSLTFTSLYFIFNFSGFNMTTTVPTCSGQTYLIKKLTVFYIPLKVHTISAIIASLLSVIILIIMCKMYCALRGQENTENMNQEKMSSKCEKMALFILVSLETLCLISNAGGNLSLIIDNNCCQVVESANPKILFAISFIVFLCGVTQWILVVALDCMVEQKQDQQVISLRDFHAKNDMIREQEAMSKHLDQHAKEYISNNFNKNQDLLQGLIKKQYGVYGESDIPLERPQRLAEVPKYEYAEPVPHPQDQNYQKQNEQDEEEGQKEGKKIRKKDKKSKDKKKGTSNEVEGGTQGGKKKKTRKKEGDKLATKMHSYHAQAGPKQDNQSVPTGLTQFFFGGQGDSSSQDDSPSQDSIDKELLYAQNDDNLSQKFDQKNFQLNYDLERAMQDQQEDLSPLELKQLMRFTKDSYVLKNNNKKGLLLERQYQDPNIKINVNFVKIKEHKQQLNLEMQKLMNIETTTQNVANYQKEGKKDSNEDNDKPITEELAKILKVTLFNNSEFYKKEEEKQTECPISKYVQNDQGFQIVQSHEKTGKNKRVQYSKQQLLFSKKRKDLNQQEQREKTSLRQEFNENQSIVMERILLFGQTWANQQDKDTLARGKEKLGRSKKRKLVEVIRSKFYE